MSNCPSINPDVTCPVPLCNDCQHCKETKNGDGINEPFNLKTICELTGVPYPYAIHCEAYKKLDQ